MVKRGRPWLCLFVEDGMRMITMNNAMMLNVDPTELKLAIHLVGILLMHPCIHMIRIVRRKIW